MNKDEQGCPGEIQFQSNFKFLPRSASTSILGGMLLLSVLTGEIPFKGHHILYLLVFNLNDVALIGQT